MLRRDVLAGASLSFSAHASGQAGLTAAATAGLDAFLREQVARGLVGGIAAQVVRRDGQVVYAGGVDAGTPRATQPDTLFRLASMTKPITAVVALGFIEDGRIGLDDPVARFLPAFARPDPGPPATLRDLLRHTSGLSYRFMNVPGVADAYARLGVDDGLAAPDLTLAANMARLAAAPLAAAPGSAWNYGLSFDVLAAVVSQVAGQPFDVVVRQRLAEPLGLSSLCFHVPPAEAGRLPPALMTVPGGLRPIPPGDGVLFPVTGGRIVFDPARALAASAYPSGGGGATANLEDTVRFARMLLNGGALDGVRVLRETTLAAMASVQTGSLPISLAGPGYGFGYGVAVLDDPAAAQTPQPRGSYGWSGVYGTGLSIDPQTGLGFVVMSQTAVEGMAVADAFVRRFYALIA